MRDSLHSFRRRVAAGEREDKRDAAAADDLKLSGRDSLTPSERRVAELAAAGMTTAGSPIPLRHSERREVAPTKRLRQARDHIARAASRGP
jgi:hypothetical protein